LPRVELRVVSMPHLEFHDAQWIEFARAEEEAYLERRRITSAGGSGEGTQSLSTRIKQSPANAH
jgi:hypothetical protein